MNTSSSIIKESFYISINLEQLVFTQGSVLGELIDRLNIDRKSYQEKISNNKNKYNQQSKDHSQLSADISELLREKEEKKAVFLVELLKGIYFFNYILVNKTESKEYQEHQLCQSLSIARINSIEPTTKLYEYPINLTSLEIKSKDELSSFVYEYSPMQEQEVVLRVSLKLSAQEKDSILIGECVIDLNLFVEMFLDEGTQCVKDCKRLAKRIDQNKEIDQNVDAVIELYIERDRVSLERVKINSKKGINVVDFKEQIKKIMRERKLIQAGEGEVEGQILSESIQSEPKEELKNSSKEKQNSSNNKSLSAKYHKYLQLNVEERLKYIHPKKDLIQNEVDALMKQREEILLCEQKNKKSLSPEKKNAEKSNKKAEIEHNTKALSSTKETKKEPAERPNDSTMEKLKIALFVIFSAILMYLAMTPSRKDVSISSGEEM